MLENNASQKAPRVNEHELVKIEHLSELIRGDKKFAEAVKFMKQTRFPPAERGNGQGKFEATLEVKRKRVKTFFPLGKHFSLAWLQSNVHNMNCQTSDRF